MGHQVKLLPAKHVKAFVLRDMTDALDAQAIWVTAQQSHINGVAVKSEQQQACISLHSMRQQLMKMRTMQTNALRGLLYEFGVVLPVGHNKLLQSVQATLASAQQANQLPDIVVVSVQEQLKRIDAIAERHRPAQQALGQHAKAEPTNDGCSGRPRCGRFDGYRIGCNGWGRLNVQIGTTVCFVVGVDTSSGWNGW
jgi:transposase